LGGLLITQDRKASPDGAIFFPLTIIFFSVPLRQNLCNMERVNVFVDGFNFYYGLKDMKKIDREWQKFYWLDYVKFFSHFIGSGQELQKVIYFAAEPPPPEPPTLGSNQGRLRQKLLFNVNKAINGSRFELVMGKFLRKTLTCKVCRAQYTAYEEKNTDVNIATRLLSDCTLNNADTFILVTADSDLIAPLKFIRQHYPTKKLRIYFPPGNISSVLDVFMKDYGKPVIRLERSKPKFEKSIMPDIVTVGRKTYTVPTKWKGV